MSAKKIKIAVIGAGHWGPNLIRNFHSHPESTVSWVSDLDPVRLSAVAKNYEGIQVSSDWQAVIKKPEITAVVICTPTASHHAIAKFALEQGKHIFVEKPLATSYSESMELVELAEKKNLKIMVGHVFRFSTLPHSAPEGDPGQRGNRRPSLPHIASERDYGPIQVDVNALWDLAPHDISVLLYLLGEMPESVRGHGSAFINPPVEDVVFSTLQFKRGVLANLHVSWLDPKKVRQLVIVGSQKMLVFDDMAPGESVRIYDKNVGAGVSQSVINDTIHHFRRSIMEGTVTIPRIPGGEPLKSECDAFIHWLVHEKANPSTGRFGAEVVYLLENISRSVKNQGAPVKVDNHRLWDTAKSTRKAA